MSYHESWVERQIREATERGEFDRLPGMGKPLNLGDLDDPDWWVKAKMEREGIDPAAAIPGVLALRREAASFPESLLDVRSEDGVREVVRDYNRRVVEDRMRPVLGKQMPAVAPRVDVEEMVQRWRELRAESVASRDSLADAVADLAPPPNRPRLWPRWWRRVRRRDNRARRETP